MRNSTRNKLFKDDVLDPRVLYQTTGPNDSIITLVQYTNVNDNVRVCIIQEYENELDGFDVWAPTPNDIVLVRDSLDLLLSA